MLKVRTFVCLVAVYAGVDVAAAQGPVLAWHGEARSEGDQGGRVWFGLPAANPESSEAWTIELSCDDAEPLLRGRILLAIKPQPAGEATIQFTVDGDTYNRSFVSDYWGMIGYLPMFSLAENDPLVTALIGGANLMIDVPAAYDGPFRETLPLAGTANTFRRYLADCLKELP